MRVILKQDIRGVGRKNEIKDVSSGYANNFLFPKKMAEFATLEAMKKVEYVKVIKESEKKIEDDLVQKYFEILKDTRLVMKAKSNESGHLFASIREIDISKALKAQLNIDIYPSSIRFLQPKTPIKQSGNHSVKIVLGDKEAEFEVAVEGDTKS